MEANRSCRVCGGVVPVRPHGKTGPASPCCSDACRRERENECARRARARNPDRARENCRKHYAKHRQKMQDRNRARAAKLREWSRQGYIRNISKMKDKQRARVQSGAQREAWRRHYSKHQEREMARSRAKAQERRARIANVFIEHVDPRIVWQQGCGVCGICLSAIDPSERWHVDHIIPISRGGSHSYANTQPAHAACNVAKGDRLPDERMAS